MGEPGCNYLMLQYVATDFVHTGVVGLCFNMNSNGGS